MKKIVLLSFIIFQLQAQVEDSIFIAQGLKNAISIHSIRMDGDIPLYNGNDFLEYQPLHDEHPYFISDGWLSGSVNYDGRLYEDIFLLYDILTDNVIIENYDGTAKIQLIKNRIRNFTIDGHYFIQVNHTSILPGFYELLYDGPTRLIGKRKKEAQEVISSRELFRELKEKPRYYLFKNDQFINVSSKNSVLKLFGDHKQEVKKQFKKQHLSFRSAKEMSIKTMAELYDQISQ